MAAPAWSTFELLDAQRRRRTLRTTTPGMTGRISEVREDGVVVLALEFGGTAYLARSALASPPPSAFAVGSRVTTAYGRGHVRAVRLSPTNCDVVVDLIDCLLTGGECATAYLAPETLAPRAPFDRTFLELIEDAVASRNAGNDAFKSKDYEQAITEYRVVLDVFNHLPKVALTASQKAAVRDGVVKALSNMAQCYLSATPPNYEGAIVQCSHALEIDPVNETKQAEKLLYRRGLAYAGMGEWDKSAADLADPALSGNDPARAKLSAVRESARKEKDKNKKMWGNAFKRAAEGEGGAPDAPTTAVEAGDPALVEPASPRGVQFSATPSPGRGKGRAVEEASTPTEVRGGGAAGERVGTPFPTRGAPPAEEEDEEEEEGPDSGDGTMEATEESVGTWLTPVAIGVGVLAVAAAGLFAYSKMRR